MKNNFLSEIIISIILIILLVFLLNPFDFWMPKPAQMMAIAALAVIFIIFSLFIWREKANDERENLHRFISARFAYFTGTSLLVIGVIIQSFMHVIDPWLIIALGGMIIAKVIGNLYGRLKN